MCTGAGTASSCPGPIGLPARSILRVMSRLGSGDQAASPLVGPNAATGVMLLSICSAPSLLALALPFAHARALKRARVADGGHGASGPIEGMIDELIGEPVALTGAGGGEAGAGADAGVGEAGGGAGAGGGEAGVRAGAPPLPPQLPHQTANARSTTMRMGRRYKRMPASCHPLRGRRAGAGLISARQGRGPRGREYDHLSARRRRRCRCRPRSAWGRPALITPAMRWSVRRESRTRAQEMWSGALLVRNGRGVDGQRW